MYFIYIYIYIYIYCVNNIQLHRDFANNADEQDMGGLQFAAITSVRRRMNLLLWRLERRPNQQLLFFFFVRLCVEFQLQKKI